MAGKKNTAKYTADAIHHYVAFVYKCRRCQGVFKNGHETSLDNAIPTTLLSFAKDRAGLLDSTVPLVATHSCANSVDGNHIGLGDFAGYDILDGI